MLPIYPPPKYRVKANGYGFPKSAQDQSFKDVLRFGHFCSFGTVGPVQISMDAELQQVSGIMAGPTPNFRHHPFENHFVEIRMINKGFDKPDRIIRTNTVVNRLGKQAAFEIARNQKDVP